MTALQQQSRTAHAPTMLRIRIALITSLTLLLASCGNTTGTPRRSCDSTSRAIEEYTSTLTRITDTGTATMSELVSLVCRWKAVDDSLARHLSPAHVNTVTDSVTSRYLTLRDSIVSHLCNIAGTEHRTLSDYLSLVTALNHAPADTITARLSLTIHRLYGNLDSTPTHRLDARSTIDMYENLLDSILHSGINNRHDLFTVLRTEDMVFRTFLSHLSALGDIPLQKIRDNTTGILRSIIELASDNRQILTPGETLTVITMRNNRRLLQNAQQCVSDIRMGKVATDSRAAYLWMLLQPWLTFDTYSYSLMNQAQMNTLATLAAETPGCIRSLGNPEFPIDTDELPALLITTLISTL